MAVASGPAAVMDSTGDTSSGAGGRGPVADGGVGCEYCFEEFKKSGVPWQSTGRGGHSLAEARLWQI